MQISWLYFVAFALLLGAFIGLIYQVVRRNRARSASPRITSVSNPVDELRTHGILEVRPKSKNETGHALFGWSDEVTPNQGSPGIKQDRPNAFSHSKNPPAPSKDTRDEFAPPTPIKPVPKAKEAEAPKVNTKPEKPVTTPAAEDERLTQKVDREMVEAYLGAVKTSLKVHTLCFLRINEADAMYHLDAMVSDSQAVLKTGAFPVGQYFLDQLGDRADVLHVSDQVREADLKYYTDSPLLAEVIVAPVFRAGLTFGFLVADRLEGEPVFEQAQFKVFSEATRTLGLLMEARQGTVVSLAQAHVIDVGKTPKHQAIIQEEMEAARQEERTLGLALVYLDENGEIVKEGENEIEKTEERLYKFLVGSVTNGRVEQFGELGFGVFHYDQLLSVEHWVEETQDDFSTLNPPIPGSLIIGVVMLSALHEGPEAFQIDAARALQEAYETGKSTIIVD